VGLRAGLDRCGKFRTPPGFDPWTVQPVGSRYTDYSSFGGLEVSMLASGSRVRRSHFSDVKILSMPSFRGEVK
jgi:hypothetical protein